MKDRNDDFYAFRQSVKQRPTEQILVVSQVPPPVHGSTVMTKVFLAAMASVGVEVTLLDRRFSTTIGEVGTVRASKVLAGFGLVSRTLYALARQRWSAAVVFLTNRPASLICDWILISILYFARVPIVSYIHTSGYSELADKSLVWRFILRSVFKKVEHTVTLGKTLAGDIERWAAPADTSVIRNVPFEPRKPTGDPRDCTILFLSNLIPEKGADTFVSVAAALKDRPELSFVVAGSSQSKSYEAMLERQANDSGIADRIAFIGQVDSDDKWRLLSESAVLVFPSRYQYEAQPLTLVEAQFAGIPVVASDIGGIRDLQDRGYLRVVESSSVAQFVSAIEEILEENLYEFRTLDGEAAMAQYQSDWAGLLESICEGTNRNAGRTKVGDDR